MMSERERWIVYPLLFLAVFLGWRNQMPRSGDLECQLIRCHGLLVTSPNGEPSVEISSTAAQSGELRLFGADGGDALLVLRTDRTGNRGILETKDSDRTAQTLIVDKSRRRQLLDEDFDAGLVLVVAPAVAVIDPQDRVKVGQQVAPMQKFPDHVSDDRRAAHTTADVNTKPYVAAGIFYCLQPDIVDLDRRTIVV